MYSNVQSLKIYREREILLVYKNVVEIIDAISHKLSGQYVRCKYSMIWNGFDLQRDLERF